MRRRVMQYLQTEPLLTIQRAVELLSESGVSQHDNPYVPDQADWIPDETRNRMQAWEEAPLLDEIAVNAGYRATVINLGLVGIRYHRLDEYIQARGVELAHTLGITADQLEHLCRVLLDEIRTRGALSRPMLQYHPAHVASPAHFRAAQWERRMKQPSGYPLTPSGEVAAYLDSAQVVHGVTLRNAWRRPGRWGPSTQPRQPPPAPHHALRRSAIRRARHGADARLFAPWQLSDCQPTCMVRATVSVSCRSTPTSYGSPS